MKIATILDQIDLGTMALPKFQKREPQWKKPKKMND